MFSDCYVAESPVSHASVGEKEICISQFEVHKLLANVKTPLHYVDIEIMDENLPLRSIHALFDTETAVIILRASAMRGMDYESLGHVSLQAFDNRKSG